MDKTQAEMIAQAILEPGLRAQEETRRKREAETVRLAQKRQVARFLLAGFGIGAAVAYQTGMHVSSGGFCGGLLGGLAGSAIGWLVKHRAV